MTQEIIYTSAPRGLKPGSRGFCTVVSTSGLAKNLAERLESLSGYTHVFLPHDEHAGLNPVVHSHLRLTVGGRAYHILSRIAAAGLDYTQRSNKLAHHVALDVGELPAAGPAWLLAAPGFMQTTWDGDPKILPRGRAVPGGDQPPGICHAWEKATGDAGWGGALAETAMTAPGRAAVIIFRPGMDLLPLLAESLALVPSNLRWQVTFSTYYTSLPPGTGCQWRCVLEGSAEAKSARRLPGVLAINLCEPLGRALGGQMVELARSGVPARAAAATMLEVVEPPVLPAAVGHGPPAASKQYAVAAETFRLGPPGLDLAPAAELKPRSKKRRRRRIWIGAAIAASVLVLASGTLTAVTFIRTTRATAARVDNGAPPSKVKSGVSNLPPKETAEKLESDSKPKLKKPSANTAVKDESKLADSAPPAADPNPETAKQQSDKTQENGGDVAAQNSQPLPEKEKTSAEASKSTPPTGSVTRIQIAARLPAIVSGATEAAPVASTVQLAASDQIPIGADCALQLLGGDDLPNGRKFVLERVVRNDHAASWQVWLEPPHSAATTGRTGIAVISISDERVGFTWKVTSYRQFAERLQNCVLRVTSPSASAVLDICLRMPFDVEPVKLDFLAANPRHPLPNWRTAEMPKDDDLRFEVTETEAAATPSTTNAALRKVNLGSESIIRVDGDHGAAIDVSAQYNDRETAIDWFAEASWFEEGRTRRSSSLRSIKQDLEAAVKRVSAEIMDRREEIASARKRLTARELSDQRRQQLEDKIDKAIQAEQRAEREAEGIRSLFDVWSVLHPYGRLHFRIFMNVGEVEVDLLRTTKILPNANH